VQSLRTTCFEKGREPHLPHQIPHREGCAPDDGEVVGGGIEIEDQLIRMLDAIDPAQARVKRYASLVRKVYERRLLVTHDMCHSPTLLGHRFGLNPGREVIGRVLAEEAGSADAVGESLESQETVLDEWHHGGPDRVVVIDEIPFRDPVVREEPLI
jgi:hypothetical protein